MRRAVGDVLRRRAAGPSGSGGRRSLEQPSPHIPRREGSGAVPVRPGEGHLSHSSVLTAGDP